MKKSKFKNKEKLPLDEAIDKIELICIEQIGEEYFVKKSPDDGGMVIDVYFEEHVPALAKTLLSSDRFGWRICICTVPKGYIKAFFLHAK